MNVEQVLSTLISSAATHKEKIERLERELTRALREIEMLKGSTLSSQNGGTDGQN